MHNDISRNEDEGQSQHRLQVLAILIIQAVKKKSLKSMQEANEG